MRKDIDSIFFPQYFKIPLKACFFYTLHEILDFLLCSAFWKVHRGKIPLALWKQQNMFEKAWVFFFCWGACGLWKVTSFSQQREWEPHVRDGEAVSTLFKHQDKDFEV